VGYLLLIEIATQLFIIFFLIEGKSVLSNINLNNATNTYIDIVYYCTVTATSIGFGDILPLNHSAKMTTSLLGLSGQFYLVIIMSVMISKFNSKKVA
jgi:ACR3 family arsenite efflux pump ArsB